MMELPFHEQISGAFEPFVDEIDLARIALSCHFALDFLCFKCKEHISNYRKLATKTVYLQHEYQHERRGQQA